MNIIKQIKDWEYILNEKEVFWKELKTNEDAVTNMSTKWIIIEDFSEDWDNSYLAITSAWSPCINLQTHLLEKYWIESENEYEEPWMKFEWTYSCMKDMQFNDERTYINYCDECWEKMGSVEEDEESYIETDNWEIMYVCRKCRNDN